MILFWLDQVNSIRSSFLLRAIRKSNFEWRSDVPRYLVPRKQISPLKAHTGLLHSWFGMFLKRQNFCLKLFYWLETFIKGKSKCNPKVNQVHYFIFLIDCKTSHDLSLWLQSLRNYLQWTYPHFKDPIQAWPSYRQAFLSFYIQRKCFYKHPQNFNFLVGRKWSIPWFELRNDRDRFRFWPSRR